VGAVGVTLEGAGAKRGDYNRFAEGVWEQTSGVRGGSSPRVLIRGQGMSGYKRGDSG